MNVETYLGFDVGTKRTGIALANNLTNLANGIAVIEHPTMKIEFLEIDNIIKQYNPTKLIVGVPLTHTGQIQEMTFIARAFAKKLIKRYQLEVIEIDEYLSSNEAKKQLEYNHFHKNANRSEVDKKAAEIILQTWLSSVQ